MVGRASGGGVGGPASVSGAMGRTVAGTSRLTITAAIASGAGVAGAWARVAAAISGSAKHHPGPAWCLGARGGPGSELRALVLEAGASQAPHFIPASDTCARIGHEAIAPQPEFAGIAGVRAGARHSPVTGIAEHVA